MTDDTKTADDAKTTAALEAAPRKRGRISNGRSAPPDVPRVKVRLISTLRPGPNPESQPELDTPSDPMSTRLIPTVDGQASPDGNGGGSQLAGRLARARPGEVRP